MWDTKRWPWYVWVILFIPICIFGTVLHVKENFRHNKLGYTMLLLILGIVIFGFIMGLIAGPESPAPWENQ